MANIDFGRWGLRFPIKAYCRRATGWRICCGDYLFAVIDTGEAFDTWTTVFKLMVSLGRGVIDGDGSTTYDVSWRIGECYGRDELRCSHQCELEVACSISFEGKEYQEGQGSSKKET